MAEVEITVPVPAWLADSLALVAEICGKSIDHAASALLAREVVHTRRNSARKARKTCADFSRPRVVHTHGAN